MKSFTRPRVVKSNTVEVSIPRLVECQYEEFQFLGQHLTVVRDTTVLPEEGEALTASKHEAHRYSPNSVKEWEIEASTVLQQAQLQAEEILAQAQETLARAKEEAKNLQTKALQESEAMKVKIREEVTQKAYSQGYAEGLTQGLDEGKSQGQKEAEEIKEEAKSFLQLAQRAVQEEFQKVDHNLLRLALKVSERIVRANLKHHPDYLLERIRALTLLPQEREGWRLHIAPQDAKWLRKLPSEARLGLPLVEDESLNPGDCFLECLEGIFDARLEAQLDRFELLLEEELRYDGLEQAGR